MNAPYCVGPNGPVFAFDVKGLARAMSISEDAAERLMTKISDMKEGHRIVTVIGLIEYLQNERKPVTINTAKNNDGKATKGKEKRNMGSVAQSDSEWQDAKAGFLRSNGGRGRG